MQKSHIKTAQLTFSSSIFQSMCVDSEHEKESQKGSNITSVSLKAQSSDLRSHPKWCSYGCIPAVPGVRELG